MESITQTISIFKKCSKCWVEATNNEQLSLFNKDIRLPYGRTSVCKKCNAIKHNKWMRDNKDKLNKWRKEDIRSKQDRLADYIGGRVCKHCGFTHTSFAPFDFHHLNPNTKDASISDAICKSWDNLIIEVDKCILLCATCHRIEHERIRNETNNL